MGTTQEQLALARSAKKSINTACTALKNQALEAMASQLLKATEAILVANQIDMEAARGKISEVMLDRLFLDQERIAGMAQGIRALIDLPDPIGEMLDTEVLENGLEIQKVRVSMGVIGIIYESRPNVTSDAAALAIKSGNAVVLRTGKDAFHSAQAIVTALKAGLEEAGLNSDLLQLIQDTSRASSLAMMKAKGYLDLLIPRGGAGLIQAVVENAIVPVIETGTGIVHVYVDKDADFDMAVNIINNAKTQRISVCNACESIVVHSAIAEEFLPKLYDKLREHHVQLRCDERAQAILAGRDDVTEAASDDWGMEYLDYIMSVKIVDSIDEAIEHINRYNTSHSEAIITNDYDNAQKFLNEIDAACVYVNASTRFSDGNEFGFGAEIGISTQKLHARGPMGLEALTSYKYIIYGSGQIRE